MCIRVDLPEPDGPITAVNWPLATSTETPLSAFTVVSPLPYWRVRSWAVTTGAAVTRAGRVSRSSVCSSGLAKSGDAVRGCGCVDEISDSFSLP